MKILYIGNFSDPSYEGYMKIMRTFTQYFKKRVSLKINSFKGVRKDDLVHIHSAGLYPAIKYSHLKNPTMYSLHSNIFLNPFSVLRDYYDFYRKLYTPTEDNKSLRIRILTTLARVGSFCVPLWIKKLYLRKFNVVIVYNQNIRTKLRLSNVKVINHGIDVNAFRPRARKPTAKLRVAYFGHPTPAKGFLEVIDAFAKLDSSQFDKRMYIPITNKKNVGFIKKADSSISIQPFVKDIAKEYNKVDIVILPLRHDGAAIGTSLVLLETMACAKAIITTNIPSTKEVCKRGAYYVKPYSSKALINAVHFLKNNPSLRKKLGKAARERVVALYSQERMVSEYEKLYEQFGHTSHRQTLSNKREVAKRST